MEIPYYSFIKPYDQPIEQECYNTLFNPNICHVCKKGLGIFKFIKVCKCSMISYCCDEHKEIHQKQHQDLCDAIIEVNVHKVLWDTCSRNIVEWIDRKKRLLELVQAKLQRELKSYERQIFYFIKSCFICYGRPERNGNFCTICHCINYCNAHENALHVHKYFCSQLELSLSLDLGIIQHLEYPKMNFIIDFPNPYKHLCDMIEFVKQYALQPGQDTWFINEFILTDYTSNPLTVFYGIREMQLMDHSSKKTKPFIIHVIDAKVMDTYNLPAWELLMHLFNTSLIVIMTGHKLNDLLETNKYINVCALCQNRSNKLLFQFHSTFYDNYVNTTPSYKPNLIVGFDVIFKMPESWSKCIQIIQAQDCPFFLTNHSRSDSLENMKIINIVLHDNIRPFHQAANKFCSYAPHRDFNTGYAYVLNKRLMIYKNLRGKMYRISARVKF